MPLNPSALSILNALFGMGALSFAMCLWMTVVRMPAMKAAGVSLQDAAHVRDLATRLPSSARRVADNYNHLFEAPTVFYAVAAGIVIAGLADPVYAACAWIFLASRIGHSLVQATFNSVPVRIVFYVLSWLALAVMILRPLLTGALHA
jgi:hypothetical protein